MYEITLKESWKINPRKNGPLEKRSPEKKSSGKKIPGKKERNKKFYSTHKNVTVIFASKYKRILLMEKGFIVEF